MQIPHFDVIFSPQNPFEKEKGQLSYGFYSSPYGTVLIAEHNDRVIWLCFLEKDESFHLHELARNFPKASLQRAQHVNSLGEYLKDKGIVSCIGYGTPFQIQVWKALMHIPLGSCTHYEAIAESIKQPKATRAVANAVGANPIAWLIPCHRVLRKDGSLGGYRGGTHVKKTILAKEGVTVPA